MASQPLKGVYVAVVGGDGLEPAYVVQPGGEYRIGVGLFQGPRGKRLQVQGASWLRLALPEGQTVTLLLDQDEGQPAVLCRDVLCYALLCCAVLCCVEACCLCLSDA